MTTSQDSPRSRRAAHFSETSEGESSAKARRAATPRTAAPRKADAPRPAMPSSGATGMRSTNQMSERTARATKRAAAAHKRRTKDKRSKQKSNAVPAVALAALSAIVAVAIIGFLVVPHLFSRNEPVVEDYPTGEQVVVTIPDGASGSQIAQLLIEAHVISDENIFYAETQKQNADGLMKSGSYMFITGATPSEVVKQLVAGPNATEYQLKLPEGLTVKQTASYVEEQVGIPADEFLEQAKASNYVEDYPFLQGAAESPTGEDSLEGYLYAKTYDLGGKDMTADTVIRMMLDQFASEVNALDFKAARDNIKETYNIDISDYGIIKLASIIEKEALTDAQRPKVSSVFYNRLGRPFPGMGYVWPYLQSDATMMYVVDGEVTQADNQTDSPYSTYTNQNLPPTPICSPSILSIQAALEPEYSDNFFFYIKQDYEAFSKTAADHERATYIYESGQYLED